VERTPPSAPPTTDVAPVELTDQGPPGPWPRSSALLAVLVISFAFGALSFIPLVGAVLFYPPGALAASANFVTRSAVGDVLEILYRVLLLELGYLIGKRIAFEREHLILLVPAYFGAVLGYLIGIPDLQTTTVAGGIFLYQTNILDPVHLQSALFNSPTLMGMLITGIGLSFIFQRRSSAAGMESELTSSGRLLLIFFAVAFSAFLAYMMPPIFYEIFSSIVGPTSATTGVLYGVTTNSGVIANPFLFFIILFILGRGVNIFRDAGTVFIVMFIAALVGATAGNPVGSYVTSYAASGHGTFPNYFGTVNAFATFVSAVVEVSFAGTCLGFSAIVESATRWLKKAGAIPPPPSATGHLTGQQPTGPSSSSSMSQTFVQIAQAHVPRGGRASIIGAPACENLENVFHPAHGIRQAFHGY
jgi:hypothetical protein